MGDWLPQIPRAGLGWLELISGRASWRERFVLTGEGLGIALFLYLITLMLLIFAGGLMRGSLPSYEGTFYIVLANGLQIVAIYLVCLATQTVLGLQFRMIDLMVPVVHALVYFQVLGFLLALIAPAAYYAAFGFFGYQMFWLGRLGGKLNLSTSIAFGVLCVLALVAHLYGLYMLSAPPTA